MAGRCYTNCLQEFGGFLGGSSICWKQLVRLLWLLSLQLDLIFWKKYKKMLINGRVTLSRFARIQLKIFYFYNLWTLFSCFRENFGLESIEQTFNPKKNHPELLKKICILLFNFFAFRNSYYPQLKMWNLKMYIPQFEKYVFTKSIM